MFSTLCEVMWSNTYIDSWVSYSACRSSRTRWTNGTLQRVVGDKVVRRICHEVFTSFPAWPVLPGAPVGPGSPGGPGCPGSPFCAMCKINLIQILINFVKWAGVVYSQTLLVVLFFQLLLFHLFHLLLHQCHWSLVHLDLPVIKVITTYFFSRAIIIIVTYWFSRIPCHSFFSWWSLWTRGPLSSLQKQLEMTNNTFKIIVDVSEIITHGYSRISWCTLFPRFSWQAITSLWCFNHDINQTHLRQ